MLEINMSDVIAVIKTCMPYIVTILIVLIAAIVISIVCRKKEKPKKRIIRVSTWATTVMVIVLAVSMICMGPMSTLISLTMGKGTIDDPTAEEAKELCEEIADEGIVLLKNEENVLPLKGKTRLNVFGWASSNPCYGGNGSGALNDQYPYVDIQEGLTNAGFELNEELMDFYAAYEEERPSVSLFNQDWTLPEPPVNQYSEEILSDAKDFSDTAVIIISRVGGEGADLPENMKAEGINYTDNSDEYEDFPEGTHYLELSRSERNMVEMVCDHFEEVVVVYNGANGFELGFADEYPQIKGLLWCPGAGQTGFNSLGNILCGEINPSGKTADTLLTDLTLSPTFHNFGSFTYDNMDEFMTSEEMTGDHLPSFVNYVENIYVGYKFFETAAEEDLIDYEKTVLYPFGFGLSYSEFEQTMGKIKNADGKISFDVTVKNTGDTAGKDVVEVYYDPPYYNGGIEKASANLAAFDKTDILEPGQSQTITIEFSEEDMASYDSMGEGCYVLDEGTYSVSINQDAHHVIDSQDIKIPEKIVYDDSNARSTDKAAATNEFDFAEGNCTYLSRENGFANYEEAIAAPDDYTMPEEDKAGFINNSNYIIDDYNSPNDEMPETGAKHGIQLAELRGAEYDDGRWEELLDEMTVEEMNNMIALTGFQTQEAGSVGKIRTVDCDGTAAINNNFTGVGSVGFPSIVMLAATWNEDLSLKYGETIGKMGDEIGVSGWYAPAMNMHRSSFAGRNYEYYSEDSFLSGKMAADSVKGAMEYGVYTYIKHFALNDQECNRQSMLCTWSTEQAIREIYLKPFELAVKEGGSRAMMSSYNYIGPVWAGGCRPLLTDVLREEWGFQGMVITDYSAGFGYMNSDQAIRSGNDGMLADFDTGCNFLADTKSATSLKAMRQACKNIMYTVVNSRAYDDAELNMGMQAWEKAVIGIDILVFLLLVLWVAMEIKKYKKSDEK